MVKTIYILGYTKMSKDYYEILYYAKIPVNFENFLYTWKFFVGCLLKKGSEGEKLQEKIKIRHFFFRYHIFYPHHLNPHREGLGYHI